MTEQYKITKINQSKPKIELNLNLTNIVKMKAEKRVGKKSISQFKEMSMSAAIYDAGLIDQIRSINLVY